MNSILIVKCTYSRRKYSLSCRFHLTIAIHKQRAEKQMRTNEEEHNLYGYLPLRNKKKSWGQLSNSCHFPPTRFTAEERRDHVEISDKSRDSKVMSILLLYPR